MSSSSSPLAVTSAVPTSTTSSSSSGGGAATTSGGGSFRSEVTALWEMSVTDLDPWIRTTANANQLTSLQALSHKSSTSLQPHHQTLVHATLWHNIQQALAELAMVPLPVPQTDDDDEEDDDEGGGGGVEEPRAKRVKREGGGSGRTTGSDGARLRHKKKKKRRVEWFRRHDPYTLWLHVPVPTTNPDDEPDTTDDTPEGAEDEDVIPTPLGGKLAQLGVAGLLNAMVLKAGGYVQHKNVVEPKEDPVLVQVTTQSGNTLPLTAKQLYRVAVTWHRTIQKKVRADILVTTPLRIQDMLAPDLTAVEFASIRKRIYDTVVLGKGIHANDPSEQDDTIATAQRPSGAVLEVEKYKKCPTCNNNDQSAFVLDRKNGDVICSHCGTVVSESLMHEGSQYRKFEGEADRNHHGDAANPLFSEAHNMSTSLSGTAPTSGAGIGGWRSGKSAGIETVLRNARAYIELNVSRFGKTDRRTRTGYKDQQKKEAFVQMGHVGDALSLHEAVVQRAKELFAGFRDDRELVQQFKGVIAACLCEAFEQLSTAGHNILKQDEETNNANNANNGGGPAPVYSARAARRNELHHAKLAGKGGLLLDFSSMPKGPEAAPAANNANGTTSGTNNNSPSAATAVQTALEEVSAAAWDLEHCRSWLLEASRQIAQQWVEQRNKGTSKRYPEGTLEELEGQLVEHSFTLCEQLESELQSRNSKAAARGRVITPRAGNMAKLGIKWQHSHERGSGGKGGVGGSGTAKIAATDRTAGQILILKTAKKLGSILKDAVAGEAIHKELRLLVGRQEARKLKERREEASRQRLQQMRRKPWLQARVQPGAS